jgi:hypothetical protein
VLDLSFWASWSPPEREAGLSLTDFCWEPRL